MSATWAQRLQAGEPSFEEAGIERLMDKVWPLGWRELEPEPKPGPPLPTAENARQVRQLMQTLFGDDEKAA
jgi:hypothetical protein